MDGSDTPGIVSAPGWGPLTALATLEPVVLAHQGGWDEMLLVLAPVAVFASVLWLANRRAQAQLDRRGGTDVPSASDTFGSAADDPSPDT
jgi:cyanate permease